MKITSIRYARPDDPIYSGGLQMSFHNRSKKPTTTSEKDATGEAPATSKKSPIKQSKK